MPSPDDRLHLTLAALAVAARGRYTPDGRQYATVEIDERQRVEWQILPAELDRMEAWGWIELLPPAEGTGDAPVRVTEKGDYWLTKWLKRNRRRLPQLLAEYAPGRRPDCEIEVTAVR